MTNETTGRRVADIRRRLGMSQRELATAINRSESWVSQVERGVLPVERITVLRTLADALGVPVHDLRPDVDEDGDQTQPEVAVTPVNELDAVRLALTGHPALGFLFGTPRSVEISQLSARVDNAWELTHAARHAELSAMLPALITDLEMATRDADGSSRLSLYQELARTYQAASAAFARQDEADASLVAADRGIRAAESAGNALWVLAGHFRMMHAFIRLQRFDQAERVTFDALEALTLQAESDDASPEILSLHGALHLVAAVLGAREGDRRSAREHLDAASATAARIGADRDDFDTEFGPTNVLLHRVTIAADLGDAGEALEIAAGMNVSHLSLERQARFWLDVARSHLQRRHVGDVLEAWLTAERLSPELVHNHQLSRDAISLMLRIAGSHPAPELGDLADRAGVDVVNSSPYPGIPSTGW